MRVVNYLGTLLNIALFAVNFLAGNYFFVAINMVGIGFGIAAEIGYARKAQE